MCGICSFADVGFVDGWRDNHVLIFYANIYCIYTEHTDELQLEGLKAADCSLPTGWLKKFYSWLGSICFHLYVYVLTPMSVRLK
jgi:hypothetical protein